MWPMADTVYLNDGSTEIIFDDNGDFLERLIYERLCRDSSELFKEYVEEQKQGAVDRLLDREADGYLAMCRDAMERFEKLMRLLDAPRLNRKELKKIACAGYADLYNNL